MNALAFDTLRFAKRLQAAGLEQKQAEAFSEAFSDAVQGSVATKADLEQAVNELRAEIGQSRAETGQLRTDMHSEIAKLRSDMHSEIAKLRSDMHSEIAKLRSDIRAEFRESHLNLIKWLVPTLLGQTAAILAAIKLL